MRKKNISFIALFLSVTVGIQPCAFVHAEEVESDILMESNETASDESWVTGQQEQKVEECDQKISDETTDIVSGIAGTQDMPEEEMIIGTSDISETKMVTGTCESTEKVTLEMLEDYLNKTASYLQENVTNPQCNSIGGEWAILGLARYHGVSKEMKQVYLTNLHEVLRKKKGVLSKNKYTEYSRVILALSAIGENVHDTADYDLTIPLAKLEKVCFQGANGPTWALIALDSRNYEIPSLSPEEQEKYTQSTRKNMIKALLDKRNENGIWDVGADCSGMGAGVDMTAMAIQALSNYYTAEYPDVIQAVDHAMQQISLLQQEDGGYGSSEADVQVIVALNAMGIPMDDPRFVKNGKTVFDDLMTYYQSSTGAFEHLRGQGINQMATEQGMYALVSYYRFLTGQKKLYDMTDVAINQQPTISQKEFIKRVDALQEPICLDQKEEVIFLNREIELQSSLPDREALGEKLQKWKNEIEGLETVVAELDQSLWEQIDPLHISLQQKDIIEGLYQRYEQIQKEDRKYLTYEKDLLKAKDIIDHLSQGIVSKALFENIFLNQELFTYQGKIDGKYDYTISIHGEKGGTPEDMDVKINVGACGEGKVKDSIFDFYMEQEGILPTEITITISAGLKNGSYYIYRRHPKTQKMTAIQAAVVDDGTIVFDTKAGGDFQIVPIEKKEEEEKILTAAHKEKKDIQTIRKHPKRKMVTRKSSQQKKSNASTANHGMIKADHGIIKEDFFEKIKGQKENYKFIGKTEDGKTYGITFHGKDIKKPMDFYVGITFDGDNRKYIQQLADTFEMIHFEHQGEFPGEALVETEVALEDGTYLLFHYNETDKKAEYVQKVELKENKTRFVVSQGGDYFITQRAKTKSLNENTETPEESVIVRGTKKELIQTATPTVHKKKASCNIWEWIFSGVVGIALLSGVIGIWIRKRRKEHEK